MGVLPIICSVDVRVYSFLSGFAGNWTLDRLASHEETNILIKGGVYSVLYWYLWFRGGRDRQKRQTAIIAFLIAAVLSVIAARTIAFAAPFRLRPMFDPAIAHPSYSVVFTYNLENWSSFPSDTAAFFSALAFGLAYLSRRVATPIVLYTLGWICLVRVYLGIHYASDIIVGVAIGAAMAWGSLKSDLLQSIVAKRMLQAAETKPHWFYSIAFLVSFEMATAFTECRDVGRAMLHAAQVSLQLRSFHFGHNGPMDEWGGVVLIAGFLLAICLVFVLRLHAREHRTTTKPEA